MYLSKLILFFIFKEGVTSNLTFSILKSRYLANSLDNLNGNYDVMNKMNRAEYDVIISILLKATKECSVLKVIDAYKAPYAGICFAGPR